MQLSRSVFVAVSVVGIALGATLTSGPADAQQASSTVIITKHVVGIAPTGTIFTVRYVCQGPGGPEDHFTGTISYDATGMPSANNSFTAAAGTRCTISEIEAGGATGVTWSCSESPVGSACGDPANEFTVGDAGQSIDVVVTNAMPARSAVLIRKNVLGAAPTAAVFEVDYTCAVQGELAHEFSGSVTFDATGAPLAHDNFTAPQGTQCTVTETADGGAANVTYLCEDVPRGNSCNGLQTTTPPRFTIGSLDGSVIITVQNAMTRIDAVQVQPTLTG
jgi:hypothetical protein